MPANETLQHIIEKKNFFQLDWRNGCGGEDGCGDAKKVAVLLLEEQANKQKYKRNRKYKEQAQKKRKYNRQI